MPPSVIQLVRVLHQPPQVPEVPGVNVRSYRDAADLERWLELREAAFADEQPAVGVWARADVERELIARPWWDPERLWLAESSGGDLVGSVALAERSGPLQTRPAVHWLMVLPMWRRRGLARLLLAHAEQFCWQRGWRHLVLETHAGWEAALACYRALGWRNAAR